MVSRLFLLRHNGHEYPLEYDTNDGLEILKFQIFSLTSIPPDEQQVRGHPGIQIPCIFLLTFFIHFPIFFFLESSTDWAVAGGCVLFHSVAFLLKIPSRGGEKIVVEEGNLLLTESSDLAAVSEKLRLLSVQDVPPEAPIVSAGKAAMSDEELARLLQAEEEALYLQEIQATGSRREFEERVRSYVPQVLLYEDPSRQEAARKTVPVDELEEKALVSLAKEGNFKPSKDEKDVAFLLELLFWFKKSFRWVNSPPCDSCGGETINQGMGTPLPPERQYGASRVEIYRCNLCARITRFPRYNDPLKLLETRRGRCGEWANCFTLYCRAFGYEARLILDFTDHVWTECFLLSLGRWMHLDPCEGIYDEPLLYEKGWGKKLNYLIAISKDGVHDVTKRYTKKWHEVLPRRTITTETVVSGVLSDITKELRSGYPSELVSMLEHRDRKEIEELVTNANLQADTSLSLPGRQSGAKEWRMARSELGSDENNSLSSSSCPIRKCFDVHVTKIYSAFSLLLLCLSDEGIPKSEAIQILEGVRKLLVDLKASSFKDRSAFLDSSASLFFKEINPSLSTLLDALSLTGVILPENKIYVSLSGDPLRTALALPVALDVAEEIINAILDSSDSADNFPLCFSKLNRISCGTVLASGEQHPFGTATSAFDGISKSKWEEPNGARGCWLIYKTVDGKMYDLEKYELMSGNDAPERDPADWILEGSADDGSTWFTLDTQSSQLFGERFQRKMFKIKTRRSSNAFRFRFLSVRDPKQPRFQIGSIDLCGKLI